MGITDTTETGANAVCQDTLKVTVRVFVMDLLPDIRTVYFYPFQTTAGGTLPTICGSNNGQHSEFNASHSGQLQQKLYTSFFLLSVR